MAPHADAAANGSVNGSATQSNLFKVESPDVVYTDNEINTKYVYRTTSVTRTDDGKYVASPKETVYNFKVDRKASKLGMMLVGWGGNNGTTVTAGIMANRCAFVWDTCETTRAANYYGSMFFMSLIPETAEDVNIPLPRHASHDQPERSRRRPLGTSVGMNLGDAMGPRCCPSTPPSRRWARKHMARIDTIAQTFIAANQEDRADNVLPGLQGLLGPRRAAPQGYSLNPVILPRFKKREDNSLCTHKSGSEFKSANGLDKVIVLWTANTERYADIVAGVNDTADNLVKAIKEGHEEVSPSTVFAVASILENSPFINGSPQNTFVPGAIQFAEQHGAFIGGDDFKSGQTKMKSALVDFLINAGIKLTSIASYNHLGNNDGKNLSSHRQFRSKEISKSNVVDDMVAANHVLYKKGEHPDHTVVIKYMPAVGDIKRALDEYHAEIFLGGHQTISMFNVCEDSLLASPLILDLVLLAEVMTRVSWKVADGGDKFKGFHSVLSVLSYMLKAPMTPPGTPVVNALAKQRAAVTNIFRACVGLQPESDMTLEHKLF
ncbi:LOW QUALITY PROTEIN: inositol-3-phosphate synthase [Coccidioides immitis H538.4]|uniref:inositol-3-phosphate synthase n=1 Tax=Coccidioides immitis H538.4 TaxID=396776 RepID=A0A0J8RUE2_COCIT|nr:LOW QUALITY PROTEIN: inositol-3-phosphate synthase [Coccidioides immitis H538.4]